MSRLCLQFQPGPPLHTFAWRPLGVVPRLQSSPHLGLTKLSFVRLGLGVGQLGAGYIQTRPKRVPHPLFERGAASWAEPNYQLLPLYIP